MTTPAPGFAALAIVTGPAVLPGVTGAAAADTIVLPYNDIDAVQQTFARFGEQIAAVITEASPGNMGVVPPGPG